MDLLNDTIEDDGIPIDKIIIPVFYTLIVVFGISGNILVLLVVLRNAYYRRSSIHVFIGHLAVSDLLFLLFCLPVHTIIYVHDTWPFGDALCRIVHFLQFSTMQSSALFAVTMAVDRYFAISRAVRARFGRNPSAARVFAVFVWAFTFITNAPWLYIYKLEVYSINPLTNATLNPPSAICSYSFPSLVTKQAMFVARSFIGYVLPSILIVVFSCLLLYRLWIFEHPVCNQEFVRTKKRVTALAFAISFTFLGCWLPFHCCTLFATFAPIEFLQANVLTVIYFRIVAHAISYANSCLNPIIYNFLSQNFRRGFVKLLCQGSCLSNQLHVDNRLIEMQRRPPDTNSRITYRH